MKQISLISGGIVLVIALSIGGCKLKRTVHYNWFYRDTVQMQIDTAIAPLNARIVALEAEVKNLKEKK